MVNYQQQVENAHREKKAISFSIVVYKEVFYTTRAFVSLVNSFEYSGLFCNIYVYDNTDTEEWNVTNNITPSNFKVNYYRDKSNPGISKAYNFLASEAQKNGAEWLVFLDQDTELPETAVKRYTNAIQANPEVLVKAPVLMVGNKVFSPFRMIFKRSVEIKDPQPGVTSLKNVAIVNSGMLINLNLFFNVSGYNECVKLDFADFLFQDRIKTRTNAIEILNLKCKHEFSNNEMSVQKVLRRYNIYITDLLNCPKPDFKSRIEYFILALLHTTKLSVRFRSFSFLKIWSEKIFFKSNVI